MLLAVPSECHQAWCCPVKVPRRCENCSALLLDRPGKWHKLKELFANKTTAPPSDSPAVSCGSGVEEEAAFRTLCVDEISALDLLGAKLRGNRALFFDFQGDSAFVPLGWGHGLSAAYALHAICRRVHRYCYISLYDWNIDAFYGYASGSSWGRPSQIETGQYRTVRRLRLTHSLSTSAGVQLLLEQLESQGHEAALVHIVASGHWPPRVGLGAAVSSREHS